MQKFSRFLFTFSFVILLVACQNKVEKSTGIVNVHLNADAIAINPISYYDSNSEIVLDNIFQSLLHIDRKTNEIIPVLAESRPLIRTEPNGKMHFKYKLRPEAKWENGTPITRSDIEFSLKLALVPQIIDYGKRKYFDFIEDFLPDSDDSLSFTIISNTIYLLAEISSGMFYVLPKKNYDPNGILEKFSLQKILSRSKDLENDPDLMAFADNFNAEKYHRNPDYIKGSGPYQLQSWQTGQKITIIKNENWWGNALEGLNSSFEAYPKKIVYHVIPDQNTALIALKNGHIDVSSEMKAKDFIALQKNEKFASTFHFYTPLDFEYNYIGLNNISGLLTQKKIRQAFAHLLNIPQIIEVIHLGMAEQIIGPIHPSNKGAYNQEIVPYEFNPQKALNLLKLLGWIDTNKNGILDLTIDGEKTEFEISLLFNSGNEERKALALMLQEEARKIGIKINLINYEGSTYLDLIKKGKFDLFIGSFGTSPFPEDLTSTYHRSSIGIASNFTGFGTAESDSIIDKIKVELDNEKRNLLYHKAQEMIHEEACTLFLFARSNRLIINKKFTLAPPSFVRPGYWAAGFKE